MPNRLMTTRNGHEADNVYTKNSKYRRLSLLLKVIDALYSYDYFISYKHSDGLNYPNDLAKLLAEKRCTVFLDKTDYPPGAHLPEETKRRVRMSSHLILVARKGALTDSDWVMEEVRTCIASRKTPIVIDIDNAFENIVIKQDFTEIDDLDDAKRRRAAELKEVLGNFTWISETTGSTIRTGFDGSPTRTTVGKIVEGLKARRRNSRRVRILSAAVAVLIVATVAAFIFASRSFESETRTREQAAATAYGSGLREQQRGHDEIALAQFARSIRLHDSAAVRAAIMMMLANRHWMSIAMPDLTHAGTVNSAHFDQDGKRIITASADMSAQMWNADTGQTIGKPMRHSDIVYGARFSPDGNRIVTYSNDGTAQLWTADTQRPIGEPMRHDHIPSERFWVTDAEFSNSGKLLATGSFDGTARVWDGFTGKPISQPLFHGAWVDSVEFNNDETRLLTATDSPPRLNAARNISEKVPDSGTAQVWDFFNSASSLLTITHKNGVRNAHFSPDNKWIVTSAGLPSAGSVSPNKDTTCEGTACLSDAQNGTVKSTLVIGRRTYNAVFSRDGSKIVAASGEAVSGEIAEARVWDMASGQPLKPQALEHGGTVRNAVFSNDGKLLVTASEDNTARVWDAETGKPLGAPLRHQGVVVAAEFSADGKKVLTASEDRTARIWDVETGQPATPLLSRDGRVERAEYSLDGKYVVTISDTTKPSVAWWTVLRDADTGVPISVTPKQVDPINTVTFDHNAHRFVTTSDDGFARIWDTGDRKLSSNPIQLHHEGGKVVGAWFSRDDKLLLTIVAGASKYGRYAFIWDVAKAIRIKHFGPYEAIKSGEFSPDGTKVLLTTARDACLFSAAPNKDEQAFSISHPPMTDTSEADAAKKTNICLVGTDTDKSQLVHAFSHQLAVNAAHFSEDGQWVVTASDDQTARIWDAITGDQNGLALEHKGIVTDARFSFDPSGRSVVTASTDGYARIWDRRTSQLKGALMGHDGPVLQATFSPDGRLVATASADQTARLFDAADGQPFGMLLPHQAKVNGVQFSHDGRHLLTTANDKSARIWTIPDSETTDTQLLPDLAETVGRVKINDLGTPSGQPYDQTKAGKLRDAVLARKFDAASESDRVLRELVK